ncbi:Uncharacterised protein family, glycosyl hydrolase catalytic domain [Ceraceosorus bombacis]|uniref:Uncharacterized protein family, glycosyl hydrolase catalytic domain n=1 Tax=Ceraceosorus bombacis TaxID=401625 RepID=A0A0P1BTQ7_9BASI|nr:Uncharacterised protein family, glycosyl hydrolase catalytic domain [Ceraceosorus bombacis]
MATNPKEGTTTPPSSSNAASGSDKNSHGGPAPGAGDNPIPKAQQNPGTPTQAISHGTPSKSPKGGKAGVAGGESLKWTAEVLGWWHNWGPVPDNGHAGNLAFMSTCWGIGQTGGNNDAERFEKFKKVPHGKYPYVAGFNEMDFQGHASSGGMSLDAAVHVWEQYIAPHKAKGSILVSPSCAKQKDEDMCGKFLKRVKTKPDLVNLHIFQEHPDGVMPVIEHYRAYGYKMIITELACINFQNGGRKECSMEEQRKFWATVIPLLEKDDDIVGWAASVSISCILALRCLHSPHTPLPLSRLQDAYDNGNLSVLSKGNSLTETGKFIKAVIKSTASKHKRRALSDGERVARRSIRLAATL